MIKGRLVNVRGESILETVYRAQGSVERMRGLLGRSPLKLNEGLWIEPCNSVHTLFMKYPIDVLFLDREGVLLKVANHLNPWRFAAALNARITLELHAGAASSFDLQAGDCLAWQAGE